MHTISVTLQGAANDSASIELPDGEALPVYVKLKELLSAARVPRRTPRKEVSSASPAPPEGLQPSDSSAAPLEEGTGELIRGGRS